MTAARRSHPSALFALVVLAATASACVRPGGPENTSTEFGDGVQVFKTGLKCTPVVSAERLPPRSVVSNPGSGASDGTTMFTSDLFNKFVTLCGTCHVTSNYGDWSVPNKGVFAQLVTRELVDRRIKTDVGGDDGYMPPANAGGKPFSQRTANDPISQFARLLDLWLAQGSPLTEFSLVPTDGGVAPDASAPEGGVPDGATPEAGAPEAGAPDADTPDAPAPEVSAPVASPREAGVAPSATADYTLTPAQAAALTNIGTCVPNRYAVGIDHGPMDDRDDFFAHATELPETLAETDLTTFDSELLARKGVVSFVPAYPLWSDSAGKMRHVRVPRGQSIAFDARTQGFDIPRNTRFYKTFFKTVIQMDGSKVEKKVETRIIVARPDHTKADGTVEQTALFGTYLWNEAETQAVLLKDPRHDGKPFTDRLLTYIADEPRAAAIRASNPRNLEHALDVENPGVRRHYAVPSSERCVQCHMGSPSASFVLGFTPVQIATRPPGWSGVIETAAGDELTQLDRLIAYGVISGMTSPSEVKKLEESQLPRVPRNEYELRAQAYLLGNCSHCHNPRGFPSIKEPELKEVLNFLPGPTGGVFQFPLDRVSPVRARGANQDTLIPYITPSLYDIYRSHGQASIAKSFTCTVPAESLTLYCPVVPPGTVQGVCGNGICETQDQVELKPEDDNNCPEDCLASVQAPWRSLIYRNVDTPFDYVDDTTIFPHMPMNTPGYDCRVAQIMGDWMVSIPAARFKTNKEAFDETEVPYYEVRPGEAAYSKAVTDADKRLAAYHAGHRYTYCPDITDIVDPVVGSGMPPLQTPPISFTYAGDVQSQKLVMPPITPRRAHWVVTDATDPPGDWLPRGDGWKEALVSHMVASDSGLVGKALNDLRDVISTLSEIRITPEMKSKFLTEVPFAAWVRKPACDFAAVPRAGDFQGANRPFWFNKDPATRDPGAPVYMLSPGAAVFTNICVNCHGPQADAKGLLADEISIMTGGNARVANFRTGLFGPLEGVGANRARVFGPNAVSPETADDLGARYMSWMALGGTKKQLPPELIAIVAATPVAGASRSISAQKGSANMLELARDLCKQVLVSDSTQVSAKVSGTQKALDWTGQTALINKNGDAELWIDLCSFGNKPVVRVLSPDPGGSESESVWVNRSNASGVPAGTAVADLYVSAQSLYWGDVYPSDAEVLDQHGEIKKGITPDNTVPMCVRKPAEPEALGIAERSRHIGGADGYVVPWCPDALFVRQADGSREWKLVVGLEQNAFTFPDADKWATRGAINAGFAVFLYLDQVSKGLVQPKPRYNQCEKLNQTVAH